ncbi:hypothetical protein F2P79_024784 [Pimephales promelas]|nr:hypothetical protein F2P79_024784 [Pimephales promelas]
MSKCFPRRQLGDALGRHRSMAKKRPCALSSRERGRGREGEREGGDAASVSCSRQRTAAVPVTVAAVLYCSAKAFPFSLQPTKGAEDEENRHMHLSLRNAS